MTDSFDDPPESSTNADERNRRTETLALTLAAATASVVLLYFFGSIPTDYYKYHTAARDWWTGDALLYERYGFFYMPWSLALTWPMSFLEPRLGAAVFRTLSAFCFVYATSVVVHTSLASDPDAGRVGVLPTLAATLLNPFSLLVIYMSQWDTLTIAAAMYGFLAARDERPWALGFALVVMASKPSNIWLPALLLLATMARWKLPLIAKTLALPAIVGALSFVAAGLDWPARYWTMMQDEPPRSINVALPRHAAFGVPLWPLAIVLAIVVLIWLVRRFRRGTRLFDFVLALDLNLVLTLYALPYHYAQAAPAIAWLTCRSAVFGALALASGIVGIVVFWNHSGSPVMNLYPALVAALLIVWQHRHRQVKQA